ncbi:MAG: hypothetical protein ABSH03_15075 [Candidatus Lustribacter sp.]|jgi:hypothetical protein
MFTRFLTGSIIGAFLFGVASPIGAETPVQWYTTDGEDSYQIAGHAERTDIVYAGTQRLTIDRHGSVTHFTATVTYDRRESGSATHVTGAFSANILASGEERDSSDNDPDYLTILNQPFSIELDAPTLHDLRGLVRPVPFDFPSPMTGALLHGSLRRLPDGILNGRRVLGIAFAARGPLNGALPDHPATSVSGAITMNGTAYYAYADALLMALDATLRIDGKVSNTGQNDPVTIVYKRTIRPLTP